MPEPANSLHRKLAGPNRRPATQLIEAAEAAAQSRIEEFGGFARETIAQMDRLMAALASAPSEQDWKKLAFLARDMSVGASIAGWPGVASLGSLLERAIGERDPGDGRLLQLARAQHDALKLVMAGKASNAAIWQSLMASLARAAHSLPRKGEPAAVIVLHRHDSLGARADASRAAALVNGRLNKE